MTPETKRSLILGGGLILAVVLGIVVYKKYEANSQASQASSDQATQDELAYIESLSLSGGGYSDYGGGAGSAITIPSPPATQSLAQELAQIEQTFGFGAAPSTTPAAPPSQPVNRNLPVSSGPPNQPHASYALGGPSADLRNILDEPVGSEGSYVA